MSLPLVQGRLFPHTALRLAGVVTPYLTVWLGLYVFENVWSAVLGYHLGIIILVSLEDDWPSPARFRSAGSFWKVILFSLTGCLAGLALYFLLPVLQISPALKPSLVDWGLNSHTWLPFIGYSALINPWLEEIFWRHWLGSAHPNPVFTDAAFAGFHLIILAPFFEAAWLVVVFIILLASAWMWRQVNRIENSMLASTLFHMSADVSILVVIWSVLGS